MHRIHRRRAVERYHRRQIGIGARVPDRTNIAAWIDHDLQVQLLKCAKRPVEYASHCKGNRCRRVAAGKDLDVRTARELQIAACDPGAIKGLASGNGDCLEVQVRRGQGQRQRDGIVRIGSDISVDDDFFEQP